MELTQNYFELFDLPVSFEIDRDDLGQKYRQLQQSNHPDNFAQATEAERRLAMQKSTHINEAFHTLKDPMSRGRYLLQLHGVDVNIEGDMTMDSQFLMTQMELREQLAALKQHPQALESLGQLMSQLETSMQQLTTTLSQQFAQGDYQAARDSVRRFQFFKKLYEEATALEEELI